MAKQSGLHQIRGKVGEHSYYRQSGVASGLIRAINQGMSQRVKTGDEYANVRLNNAEFGQAGRIASMVAMYIQPKFRPMVLPFSQSKMAKIILEYLKLNTIADWGQRNLTTDNAAQAQVDALNAVAKNAFNEWGISIVVDEENTTLTLGYTNETNNKLIAIGADGAEIKFASAASWIGTYSVADRKYSPSFARANFYSVGIEAPLETGTDDIIYAVRPAPPVDWPAFAAGRMGIITVLPYRTINGVNHYLQENCTYFAFLLQDGPIL